MKSFPNHSQYRAHVSHPLGRYHPCPQPVPGDMLTFHVVLKAQREESRNGHNDVSLLAYHYAYDTLDDTNTLITAQEPNFASPRPSGKNNWHVIQIEVD